MIWKKKIGTWRKTGFFVYRFLRGNTKNMFCDLFPTLKFQLTPYSICLACLRNEKGGLTAAGLRNSMLMKIGLNNFKIVSILFSEKSFSLFLSFGAKSNNSYLILLYPFTLFFFLFCLKRHSLKTPLSLIYRTKHLANKPTNQINKIL